jgi:hypothetical protein
MGTVRQIQIGQIQKADYEEEKGQIFIYADDPLGRPMKLKISAENLNTLIAYLQSVWSESAALQNPNRVPRPFLPTSFDVGEWQGFAMFRIHTANGLRLDFAMNPKGDLQKVQHHADALFRQLIGDNPSKTLQ